MKVNVEKAFDKEAFVEKFILVVPTKPKKSYVVDDDKLLVFETREEAEAVARDMEIRAAGVTP